MGSNYPSADIFDHVPQQSDYPYVKIGGLDIQRNDTDSELGYNATLNISSYSRYRGMKQVTEIMGHIYDALHYYNLDDDVTINGISTISQTIQKVATDTDGLTRIGMQRFNIIFEKL